MIIILHVLITLFHTVVVRRWFDHMFVDVRTLASNICSRWMGLFLINEFSIKVCLLESVQVVLCCSWCGKSVLFTRISFMRRKSWRLCHQVVIFYFLLVFYWFHRKELVWEEKNISVNFEQVRRVVPPRAPLGIEVLYHLNGDNKRINNNT